MKIKLVLGIVVLLALLLLADGVAAMSSTNYKLDWFVPLTGGAGGASSSANYAVNLTMGQSAIGSSSSASYRIGMGYWYGLLDQFRLFLPLVFR